jgi:hypothetical protein
LDQQEVWDQVDHKDFKESKVSKEELDLAVTMALLDQQVRKDPEVSKV